MITVVLVGSESAGNVGAVARAMKNFELSELVLINPKCNHLDNESFGRAMHAKDILKAAKLKRFSYLDSFDCVIGTTALLGSDYNIPRSPLTPEELADKLKNFKGKAAIVFGRESTGLTNREISRCDFVVSIPASKKYSTLNLASSAAIIFYELFKKIAKEKTGQQITPISKKEKEVVLKTIGKILDKMEFSAPSKKQTQQKLWRHIIGKAMLTKREAFALLGFLKKVK
jgi:TrmH family RNA methyltransferase